jgi:trehalose 6-phosphate phosphatase
VKRILAKAQDEVLEQLAWSNVLLGFDFDGTLAPIVDDPDAATMRPLTRKLLTRVAALYPCVVISGRARPDVERRLAGTGVRAVLGNHGLEPWCATYDLRRIVNTWIGKFVRALDGVPGVEIEDKSFSLAIHYRRSRRKKAALTKIAECAASLANARIVGGKQVVNIVPAGAPHKGVALERERERLACDTAFFVGDDETDEDVFALERSGRLLTVRVGSSRRSQAAYYIEDQSEIDALLTRFAALRARARAGRRGFGS